MAGKLTTHALDTVSGRGAAALQVDIRRITPDPFQFPGVTLDDNGRGLLLAASDARTGRYEISFHVADYHRRQNIPVDEPPLFDTIITQFNIVQSGKDCHVPLLFSPYSYTIYRGV